VVEISDFNVLRLDEIKPVIKKDSVSKDTQKDVLKDFHVGDSISIKWPTRHGAVRENKESYKSEGVIVQITDRAICFRCSAGYVCAVTRNQMVSDVLVTMKQQSKIT